MDKLKLLQRIKEIYETDGNIISYLKSIENRDKNDLQDILISYDFQAGTYMRSYKDSPEFKDLYCKYLASVIEGLGNFQSILEAGVGEATTLAPLLMKLKSKPNKVYGFDISWSRVKYAKKLADELAIESPVLFTGNLFNMPLKDNSVDIVYTSHSIEPNGGKEREALQELYRITNKYLILLEPSYEFADEEARNRMKQHGYVTALSETAKELNYNIIEHRLFDLSANLLNPTGLIIIEKNANQQIDEPLCCPVTKGSLIVNRDSCFSEESLLAYPVIDGIPCLLEQNAIVATKYLD